MTARPALIYVHGSGPQHRNRLHKQLDRALEDRYIGWSQLAFYADICWSDRPGESDPVTSEITSIAASTGDPEASALALVAVLDDRISGIEADDRPDLVETIAGLYARADDREGDERLRARVEVGNFAR